jgi:hypothetical protein
MYGLLMVIFAEVRTYGHIRRVYTVLANPIGLNRTPY